MKGSVIIILKFTHEQLFNQYLSEKKKNSKDKVGQTLSLPPKRCVKNIQTLKLMIFSELLSGAILQVKEIYI